MSPLRTTVWAAVLGLYSRVGSKEEEIGVVRLLEEVYVMFYGNGYVSEAMRGIEVGWVDRGFEVQGVLVCP